jgi:ABC-type antimicrobial peptide transport system permease subunit
MTSQQAPRRVFDSDATQRRVYLPWKRSLAMCMANVRNRRGRFLLTLVCVTVTVAFVMASMTNQSILADLARSGDVHTRAVLERAGAFTTDRTALAKQADQRTWILVLSTVLCVVGITNTMLMSVQERAREIGTLKCLGSLNIFVIRLFLLESLLVGGLGSAVGMLAGYGLGVLQAGLALEFSLLSAGLVAGPLASWGPLALAGGTVLTVVSALYPTYVAARLSPVEAMRVEV